MWWKSIISDVGRLNNNSKYNSNIVFEYHFTAYAN